MKIDKKIVGIVGLVALVVIGGLATATVDAGFAKINGSNTDGVMASNGILDQIRSRDETCDTPNNENEGNGGNGNTGGNGNGTGDGECDELTNLTGTLSQDGIWFYVDSIRLYVGPYWFISFKESAYDYDGDGSTEMIQQELLGLTGTTVTMSGHLHTSNDNEWLSVFYINGELYREPGKPIWAGPH
jgi:hypothetical protein